MAIDKLTNILRYLKPVATALDTYLAPLVDVAVRLAIFRVFFYSGTQKLDNWAGTLQLFEYEYQVPLLPPELAAYLGTAAEILCPIAILLGFATRLAALPLLCLSIVIQFLLGAANPVYNQVEHFLWMALLLTVIARGAGPLSLDRLIAWKLRI